MSSRGTEHEDLVHQSLEDAGAGLADWLYVCCATNASHTKHQRQRRHSPGYHQSIILTRTAKIAIPPTNPPSNPTSLPEAADEATVSSRLQVLMYAPSVEFLWLREFRKQEPKVTFGFRSQYWKQPLYTWTGPAQQAVRF